MSIILRDNKLYYGDMTNHPRELDLISSREDCDTMGAWLKTEARLLNAEHLRVIEHIVNTFRAMGKDAAEMWVPGMFITCLHKEPKTLVSLNLLIPIFFGTGKEYLPKRFQREYVALRKALRDLFFTQYYKTWDDVKVHYRLNYLHADSQEFEELLGKIAPLIEKPGDLRNFYYQSEHTTFMQYHTVNGKDVERNTFEYRLPIAITELADITGWLPVVQFPEEFIKMAGSAPRLLGFIQSSADLQAVLDAIPETEIKPILAETFIMFYLNQVGNLQDPSAIERYIGYVTELGIDLDPRKSRHTQVIGQPSKREYDINIPRKIKAVAAVLSENSLDNLVSAIQYMLPRAGDLRSVELLCDAFEPYVLTGLDENRFMTVATSLNSATHAHINKHTLPEIYKHNLADKALCHSLTTTPDRLTEVIGWISDPRVIGSIFANRRVYLTLFERLRTFAEMQSIHYILPAGTQNAYSILEQAQIIREVVAAGGKAIELFDAWIVGNRRDAYFGKDNPDDVIKDLHQMLTILRRNGALREMFKTEADINKLSFNPQVSETAAGGSSERAIVMSAVKSMLSATVLSAPAPASAAPQNGSASGTPKVATAADIQLQRFEKQVEDDMRAMALPQAQRAGRRTTRFFSAAQPSLDLTLYTYGDHKLSYADYKKAAIEKLVSEAAAAEAKKGEKSNMTAK